MLSAQLKLCEPILVRTQGKRVGEGPTLHSFDGCFASLNPLSESRPLCGLCMIVGESYDDE